MDERNVALERRFDGKFGIDEARALLRMLQEAVPAATLRLEFGPCATVDRGALAMLVLTAERRGASVDLHGLTQQDARVLEYLGIDTHRYQTPRTEDG